jgi:hypothetical protein
MERIFLPENLEKKNCSPIAISTSREIAGKHHLRAEGWQFSADRNLLAELCQPP